MEDKILISGLEVSCNIGLTSEERKNRQKVIVDLEIYADLGPAGESDDITKTTDYDTLSVDVKRLAEAGEFILVERLAARIAEHALGNYKTGKVVVRIRKPHALENAEYAGVEITRSR